MPAKNANDLFLILENIFKKLLWIEREEGNEHENIVLPSRNDLNNVFE